MKNVKEMLLTGVIGCGNAGSQVADLAQTEGFDCFIINSSIRDMSNVHFTQERMALIGDGRGVGKNRAKSLENLKMCIKQQIVNAKVFKDFMENKEVIFIVSSTGGGTGSGLAPSLLNILQRMYTNTKFILVSILPTDAESFDTLENTVGYMKELSNLNCTYMSYDNNKASTINGLQEINKQIVEDFKVIRGDYIEDSNTDAIDENDMRQIISVPGRLVIGRVENIDSADLVNELLKDSITNNNYSTDIDDKGVSVYGVMSSLNTQLAAKFDSNILNIRRELGEGRLFKNVTRGTTNKVAVIANGLKMFTKRINDLVDTVYEMKEAMMDQEKNTTEATWMSYDLDVLEPANTNNTNDDVIFDLDAFLADL